MQFSRGGWTGDPVTKGGPRVDQEAEGEQEKERKVGRDEEGRDSRKRKKGRSNKDKRAKPKSEVE